jgi:hypothetical protein
VTFFERIALVVANNILYVIDDAADVISKSFNSGDAWNAAFPGFEEQFHSTPQYLVQHHDLFFVIARNKLLYQSADQGASWQEIPTGIDFTENLIKKIWSEGPYLLIEAYVNQPGDDELKIYGSTDNGLSWSLLRDGLPIIKSFASNYVNEVNFVFFNDTLLLGTYAQGIFYQTTHNPFWKPLMVGDVFPRFTTALAID